MRKGKIEKKSCDTDSSSLWTHWGVYGQEQVTPALMKYLTDLRGFTSSGSTAFCRKMLEELIEKTGTLS